MEMKIHPPSCVRRALYCFVDLISTSNGWSRMIVVSVAALVVHYVESGCPWVIANQKSLPGKLNESLGIWENNADVVRSARGREEFKMINWEGGSASKGLIAGGPKGRKRWKASFFYFIFSPQRSYSTSWTYMNTWKGCVGVWQDLHSQSCPFGISLYILVSEDTLLPGEPRDKQQPRSYVQH